MLALEIEHKYSKKEILEMYMNQIYFGQGAYGIQTAAKTYFNKDVNELTLTQCAMLAGLPKSPNYYSPFNNLNEAKKRKNVVLDQMVKYGYVSAAEAEDAKNQDLGLSKSHQSKEADEYASFIDYVSQQVAKKYGDDALYKPSSPSTPRRATSWPWSAAADRIASTAPAWLSASLVRPSSLSST